MVMVERLGQELVAHRGQSQPFWAENRPTTATSAELKSRRSILVAAMEGNNRIWLPEDPAL